MVNHQDFKITGGTFNGPVVGINNGNISQNLETLKGIKAELADLLNQLKQDQLTHYYAEEIIRDLAKLKAVEKEERKTLMYKIVDCAKKLTIVAEASSKLYPLALKAFEFIKNFEF